MQIGRIYSGYDIYQNAAKVHKAERKESRAERDEAKISASAKEYQYARQALSNVPDVTAEKVEALKRRIASGSYNVPADAVADKFASALSGGEYFA